MTQNIEVLMLIRKKLFLAQFSQDTSVYEHTKCVSLWAIFCQLHS